MSLSNEPCMARPSRIDLNLTELNYYPFMIGLDKFNGSCNVADDLSTKICVPSKTKHINLKVFNMITRTYEAKTLVKHIPCDFECKFNSTTSNSNQKWNNDKCQCECKKYPTCKKSYSWNPSKCNFENGKYLKIIADTSVIFVIEL